MWIFILKKKWHWSYSLLCRICCSHAQQTTFPFKSAFSHHCCILLRNNFLRKLLNSQAINVKYRTCQTSLENRIMLQVLSHQANQRLTGTDFLIKWNIPPPHIIPVGMYAHRNNLIKNQYSNHFYRICKHFLTFSPAAQSLSKLWKLINT